MTPIEQAWEKYDKEHPLTSHKPSFLAGYQHGKEWINVDENNLPKMEVLALGYQKEILIGYIKIGTAWEGLICESEHEILIKVTHWMPKPEPPKTPLT
jgi:hypothetical protein